MAEQQPLHCHDTCDQASRTKMVLRSQFRAMKKYAAGVAKSNKSRGYQSLVFEADMLDVCIRGLTR